MFDFKETTVKNVFLPNCYDTEIEGERINPEYNFHSLKDILIGFTILQ